MYTMYNMIQVTLYKLYKVKLQCMSKILVTSILSPVIEHQPSPQALLSNHENREN